MTKRQLASLKNLEKALDRCHDAGLAGGVYEDAMRVWPIEHTEEICDSENDFFELVDEYGGTANSYMRLDGGAGW